MRRFSAGDVDVLVATTVIEVEVNIPGSSPRPAARPRRSGPRPTTTSTASSPTSRSSSPRPSAPWTGAARSSSAGARAWTGRAAGPRLRRAPERSADPETLRQRADAYVDAKFGAFEAVLAKTLEAVGRSQQKLLGRVASDDLGAHMAAQDAAGAQGHTSDADYLAGLAELATHRHPSSPSTRSRSSRRPRRATRRRSTRRRSTGSRSTRRRRTATRSSRTSRAPRVCRTRTATSRCRTRTRPTSSRPTTRTTEGPPTPLPENRRPTRTPLRPEAAPEPLGALCTGGSPVPGSRSRARTAVVVSGSHRTELPEVEVVRRGLERWVSGSTVTEVEVLHPRAVRRHLAGGPDFAARLRGVRFGTAMRRGKYLWVPIDEAASSLLGHLGMSGQLLVQPTDAPDEKHLRIRMRFDDALGTELRFVDQRTSAALAARHHPRRAARHHRVHRPGPARPALRRRRVPHRPAPAPYDGQARAPGPVADQRRRQHLRGRGALARKAALRPADRDPHPPESARENALEIGGLVGFALDLDDGRVQVVAEGSRDDCHRCWIGCAPTTHPGAWTESLRSGTPRAAVTRDSPSADRAPPTPRIRSVNAARRRVTGRPAGPPAPEMTCERTARRTMVARCGMSCKAAALTKISTPVGVPQESRAA
ncbi:Formamidopyrimidine-DNA glycosylase [Streptomyces microflavus]